MRFKTLLVLALSLLIASAAFAGGDKCTEGVQTCLNYLAKKADGKGWVGLHLDQADGGYAITKIVDGSPAASSGFKVGDVIVALNGMSIAEESEELKNFYHTKMTVGAKVTYTVKRGSHEKQVKVKLAQMPEEVLYQMVGAHMLGHAQGDEAQAEEE